MNFIKLFSIGNIAKFYQSKIIISNSDMEGKTWRGVDILQFRAPEGIWPFPPVVPSDNHAVLYHIPRHGISTDRPPKPQESWDKWDRNHVRLPTSKECLYPVENQKPGQPKKLKWKMIEEALNSSRIIDSFDKLSEAILSYNHAYRSKWKFPALKSLFKLADEEERRLFFDVTLPEMRKLALRLPELIKAPIPLLQQGQNMSISLSQEQIACLLANAFFCTFPWRNTKAQKETEYENYPHINFSALFNSSASRDVLEKLKCLIHYFVRVTTHTPCGVVTFSRRSVVPDELPRWGEATDQLADLPLHVDSEGTIEQAEELIQLDFANKYLGGGVLGHGTVQEEIRFVTYPELIVSMLFTEVMKSNEAVMMIGAEKYSDHLGYSSTFEWAGEHRDRTARDTSGRRRCAVLALDAMPFRERTRQYRPESMLRELDKAWVGFSFYAEEEERGGLRYPGLATGNWGCGAFGGSPPLKALLQLMAASRARRPMAYFTFHDTQLRDDIFRMYTALAADNVTVGRLYRYLVEYEDYSPKTDLYEYLYKRLNGSNDPDRYGRHRREADTNSPKSTPHNTTEQIQNLPSNASPDLFSQDEQSQDESQVQGKDQTDEMLSDDIRTAGSSSGDVEEMNAGPREVVASNKMSADNKMADDDKMAKHHEMTTDNRKAEKEKDANHTSRLFEEMQRFDDDNGKLNLTVGHKPVTDLNMSIDLGSDEEDTPPEVKRKITKKITDYFSKRNV